MNDECHEDDGPEGEDGHVLLAIAQGLDPAQHRQTDRAISAPAIRSEWIINDTRALRFNIVT
jgi:hypothetical protein